MGGSHFRSRPVVRTLGPVSTRVDEVASLSPDVVPVLAGPRRDAAAMAARGTAGPADIDTGMRLGAGHPRGPLEVLANLTAPERGLVEDEPRLRPAATLPTLPAGGRLARKTGAGFRTCS